MANIHIDNSYEVFKCEFQSRLEDYRHEHPDCDVFQRSMFSLKMEWAVHNALYDLHVARSRTKDVDLNHPNKWAWAYIIIGLFVWIWIK